jgi:hypothetical protein
MNKRFSDLPMILACDGFNAKRLKTCPKRKDVSEPLLGLVQLSFKQRKPPAFDAF